MLKRIIFLYIFILLPLCNMSAQCTYENRAFSGSEVINYNLYFNWKFIWIKAGTASMITATVDKYFMMRDTIMAYFSTELTPLYYRKGAREGKRYYVDEVWYSYNGNKCITNLKHLTSSGDTYKEKFVYDRCVSDMLNSFQRIRNVDPSGWKEGHVEYLDIAGGEKLVNARLIYRGKKEVKADNKKKYNCLVLSYVEKEDKKDKEIVRFYVTDDNRHVPIRLDMFLRFGSAKAFLK